MWWLTGQSASHNHISHIPMIFLTAVTLNPSTNTHAINTRLMLLPSTRVERLPQNGACVHFIWLVTTTKTTSILTQRKEMALFQNFWLRFNTTIICNQTSYLQPMVSARTFTWTWSFTKQHMEYTDIENNQGCSFGREPRNRVWISNSDLKLNTWTCLHCFTARFTKRNANMSTKLLNSLNWHNNIFAVYQDFTTSLHHCSPGTPWLGL